MPIQFVDQLPRSKKGRDRWSDTAEALRANPGEWAIIEETEERSGYDRALLNISAYIKAGTSPHFPRGEFEAAVRGTKLYARYVGHMREVDE